MATSLRLNICRCPALQVTLYFQLPVPHICRRQQMWDCTPGPSVIYCRSSVWVKSGTLTLAPRLGVNPSCSCINRAHTVMVRWRRILVVDLNPRPDHDHGDSSAAARSIRSTATDVAQRGLIPPDNQNAVAAGLEVTRCQQLWQPLRHEIVQLRQAAVMSVAGSIGRNPIHISKRFVRQIGRELAHRPPAIRTRRTVGDGRRAYRIPWIRSVALIIVLGAVRIRINDPVRRLRCKLAAAA